MASGLAALVAGCAKPPPVVQVRRFAVVRTPIERLAVMPFFPSPALRRVVPEGGISRSDVTARIGRMVTEAIQSRPVEVIPGSDLEMAFAARGEVTPRMDPALAAQVAARKFGAQAVLLGEVLRYSERGEPTRPAETRAVTRRDEREKAVRYGEPRGEVVDTTTVPASVAFTVTLYEAPSGRKLWTARFDETQRALLADLRAARRYPGRGTRWLTATELARWGAQAAAEAVPLAR